MNSQQNKFDVHELSPHLFWDTDINSLEPDKHLAFITQRVLEYGLLSDWIKFYKHFGLEKIAEAAKTLRNLDKKSLHFIAFLSGSDLNEFKCYTTKPLTQSHWLS